MAGAARAARGSLGDVAKRGIRAYHGSPHDFDQFSLSKVGTGEGAQAYGHGLYFAESPEVANTYRAKVPAMQGTGKPMVDGRPINWDDPRETAAFELWRHDGNREAAARFHENTFKNASPVAALLRSGEPLPRVQPPGHMYEVNIKADPDDFLDWDAPLSQQSDRVLSALGYHNKPRDYAAEARAVPGTPEYRALERHMDTRVGSAAVPDVTGREFYRSDVLRSTADDERALSEYLRSKGIPGLKYLDQGSRTAGEGSRNYVVFDGRLIDILRKYGLLPAAIGAGAAMPAEARR